MSKTSKLRNKIIVITGASSGIGRGLAVEAAKAKATVVLASRNEEALKEVARGCESKGARVLFSALDVTDSRAIRDLTKRVIAEFGRIDVWVNNAAVSLFSRFEEAPQEVYEQVIKTNLFGYMNGARAVLPFFREQGKGILINVSSMIGKVGTPFVSAYSTNKFAINGWSESLRMELLDAPGIHVCTILPASIDTPIFHHAGNLTGRAVKPMSPVYGPEIVIDAIIDCIGKPRREIYVGKSGAMLAAFRIFAPAVAEKMTARQVDQDHFKDEREEKNAGNLFAPDPGRFNAVTGGWDGKKPMSGKGLLALAGTVGLGAAGYFWLKDRNLPRPRPKTLLKATSGLAAPAAKRGFRKVRDSIPSLNA